MMYTHILEQLLALLVIKRNSLIDQHRAGLGALTIQGAPQRGPICHQGAPNERECSLYEVF